MNEFQIEMHARKYRHSISNAKYAIFSTLILAIGVFIGWVAITLTGISEVMIQVHP